MFQEESKIPKAMVKYASGISLESIVDILAEVTLAASPVQSATIRTLELSIKEGKIDSMVGQNKLSIGCDDVKIELILPS